jgi:hypothetical protein
MTYLYGGSGGGQIRTTNNASSLVQWLDNGKVGIGTTSPSKLLHVNGDSLLGGTTTIGGNLVGAINGLFDLGTTGVKWRNLNMSGIMDLSGVNKIHQISGHNFAQGDATMTYLYGGSGGGQIRTTNNASSLVQWLDNGKVGIGTTAPHSALHVEGTPVTTGGGDVAALLTIDNVAASANGNQAGIIFNTNNGGTANAFITAEQDASNHGTLHFGGYNGNSNRATIMTVDAGAGMVGIGTGAPATPLHVRKVGNPASGGNRSTVEEVLTLDATGYYPYTGYGVGVSFKGEDYGNTAIREYAKIQSVMTGYLSQTPAGDPSFKSALTFWTNTGGASGTLATEKVRIDNQGNVGIGTAAPSAKIHVAGTGDVARIGDNHWRGTNSVTVGTTYATGVTVNLANHKSGYLKVIISGDWSGHSAIGYMSEYFIQKGSTVRYSQPGTVIREVTNQHNTDFITSQILDPTLNDGNADFAIQFKTNTGSVSCTVMYEFTGTANSVT